MLSSPLLPHSLSPSDLPIGICRKCPYVSNIAGPLCSRSIIFSCYLLLHSLEPEVEVTGTVTQSCSDKRHSWRRRAEYKKTCTKTNSSVLRSLLWCSAQFTSYCILIKCVFPLGRGSIEHRDYGLDFSSVLCILSGSMSASAAPVQILIFALLKSQIQMFSQRFIKTMSHPCTFHTIFHWSLSENFAELLFQREIIQPSGVSHT